MEPKNKDLVKKLNKFKPGWFGLLGRINLYLWVIQEEKKYSTNQLIEKCERSLHKDEDDLTHNDCIVYYINRKWLIRR